VAANEAADAVVLPVGRLCHLSEGRTLFPAHQL
jgi:hypothetical protein